jgi:antitoxin component YwqK of YwqJK toxin-antitoxin module
MTSVFISSILSLTLLFTQADVTKQVMRKHSNGKPYVILYFNNSTKEMVKEEVFFSNGNLQWAGSYKNEMENGTWKYYYENGKIKSEQNYINGKEDGVCVDYDVTGKKVKEATWSRGKLVKELRY